MITHSVSHWAPQTSSFRMKWLTTPITILLPMSNQHEGLAEVATPSLEPMSAHTSRLVVRERSNPTASAAAPIDAHLWSHPMLRIFADESRVLEERALITGTESQRPPKLFLVPTWQGSIDGQAPHEDELPQATPESELPEIEEWISNFVLALVEIWSGKRSAAQLARWSHRKVHLQIINRPSIISQRPKIRKIYIAQPHESIAETTVTLRIGERVRALMLRFEGVDKRWVCTELVLL